jgi:hypothetical protein
MKKNYFILSCAFILGATAFAQTNLITNGNFVDETGWVSQPANSCAASGITFDAGVTRTSDGSGSWNINCTNVNNRLRNTNLNYFTTGGAGTYTVKVWVQKTGADDGVLQVYIGPNNNQLFSTEGDFNVTSTSWVEVTRTFTLDAATDYFLSFSNNGATGTNGFRVDDVLAYENAALSTESITKEDSNISIISSETEITVKTKSQISKLEVYNVMGQNVLSQISDSSILDTTILSKNLYILKVYGEDGGVSTKKFIKK